MNLVKFVHLRVAFLPLTIVVLVVLATWLAVAAGPAAWAAVAGLCLVAALELRLRGAWCAGAAMALGYAVARGRAQERLGRDPSIAEVLRQYADDVERGWP